MSIAGGAQFLLGNGLGQISSVSGGRLYQSVTTPTAGAGPFATGSATNITVSLTGLTTAAQNISAPITVTNTAVTSASIIRATVISYAYGAAGVMAAGLPVVCLGTVTPGTSFTFQIANVGTGALAGAIGINFTIQN